MSFLIPLLFNLQKHWKLIFGGGAFLALLIWGGIQKLEAAHWHKKHDHEAAAHLADNNNWIAAQLAANARATAEKAATESRYAQIQKDQAHALTLARADADARLHNWMRTHRANQGSALGSNLPVDSSPASGPDAHDSATFLVGSADLDRCTDAFVTARGWQAWWSAIEKTQGANK